MDIHILRLDLKDAKTPKDFYFRLVQLALYTYGEKYLSHEIELAKRRRLIPPETSDMFQVALRYAWIGWALPYISYLPDGVPHLEMPTVRSSLPQASAIQDFFSKIEEIDLDALPFKWNPEVNSES